MEHRFKIDVHNAAEVFAAFGLLELASWQDKGVMSYFETNGQTGATSEIVLVTKDDVTLGIKSLPVVAEEYEDPLTAPVRVGKIRLSWWLNAFETEKSGLKMWAGDSQPSFMLPKYQQLMVDTLDPNCIQHDVKTKTAKTSFGFDLRSSRDALKAGYSEKEAGEASIIFPECEFLMAIGLQNFRPNSNGTYYLWRRPVPVMLAHGACGMEIAGLRQIGFQMVEFEFVSQSQRQLAAVAAL